MEKKDIVSYNYDELQDEIKSIGEKPFRAKQIYAWLHEKLAEELNVSISTYYNWLAGRTAIPSTDLKKMANIFGANIDYLLTEAVTVGGEV